MTSIEFDCPRSVKGPFNYGKATWRDDNTCSYCGSLSENKLFEALDNGTEIGPTDKSYKIYLRAPEGYSFKQTYRNCPKDSDCKGSTDCTHWVTRDTKDSKFYFQHLSEDGKNKFIKLYNEKKIKVGYPGYFYTTPFFCSPVTTS